MSQSRGATPLINAPVDVTGLPQLADHRFQPLDPAHLKVRLVGLGVRATVIAVAAVIGAAMLSSVIPLLVGVGLLALFGVGAVLVRLEVARMGYLVRDHDLSFRRGVISRSVATIPFARVQDVSIENGPLERRYGLATLQLRTAGGQILIPGLAQDTAERLKQLLADRAAELADAEVTRAEVTGDARVIADDDG